MNDKKRIFIINTGSTSTKVGFMEDGGMIYSECIEHDRLLLLECPKIYDQIGFRKKDIMDSVSRSGISLASISAIVARGGVMRPVESGIYEINDGMVNDLINATYGEHASNLSPIIADQLSKNLMLPAYTVDPVVVDEMDDIARLSGIKSIKRRSIFHALNQKAVARKFAAETGRNYDELSLVVAHLGGGISVGAHKRGRVIDVNNAIDGDGPFSVERSGGLPVGELIRMCCDSALSYDDVRRKLVGEGGVYSYLGTSDWKSVKRKIDGGDDYAKLIYDAMRYQISKEIGSASTVISGNVDAILITGGIANDTEFVSDIEKSVRFISKVHVYPGEHEMEALGDAVTRLLNGDEKKKIY